MPINIYIDVPVNSSWPWGETMPIKTKGGLQRCLLFVLSRVVLVSIGSIAAQGAASWFSLDLANAEARSPPRQIADLYYEKIVVVEDNITTWLVAQGMLVKFGINMDLTANGE
ncbi:hypothetical protein [Candidatus Endoriftia persephone]|jgi:hypothetical protein|uniref:Uncharacterized protein n=2 Tax=Gammaproteobacteria TaxID=1236 RepID=G2DD36_9GAMM|nr:hypothetical protein [Candidatus Endoriftia persephone]EGV51476.1 hypothetical protein Rifp1Sym_bi00180 [endosymbiont of Riftia pachyptila (vent Ph05)]USF88310.1 hypothetical protein L0Y14_03460 [Candidatus Endoriftia persephone]